MTDKPTAPPSEQPLDPGKIPPVIIHGPLPDVLPDLVPRRYVPEVAEPQAGVESPTPLTRLLEEIEKESWAGGRVVYLATVKRFIVGAFEAGAASQGAAETSRGDAAAEEESGHAMAGKGVMPNERTKINRRSDVVGAAQSNQNTPTYGELWVEYRCCDTRLSFSRWLVEVNIHELMREAKK